MKLEGGTGLGSPGGDQGKEEGRRREYGGERMRGLGNVSIRCYLIGL